MNTRIIKAGFLFLMVVLLCGCASRWQIDGLKIQVESLEKSNRRLEDRTAILDSLLREQIELSNRLRADLASTLGEMDERMGIVESRLEDLGHRFPELYQKIDLVKQQVAKRDTAEVSDTTKALINVDSKQLYDAAYLDLTKGKYDLAITGFSNYLKYFPETEQADNAQYWLGECHYARKNYTKAAIEFHKVLENYSTGDKVPSALYKLGLSLLELKSVGQANKYFQELIDKYPHTQEAKLAKEKLKKNKG
ncbi:MAG: tol-pal system protein YbgF [Candidatus Zixiibacteriota bacterium]